VNPDNTIGAVGFTTRIVPSVYPITLIRFNKDTGEYLRDRNGICIKAKPGRNSGLNKYLYRLMETKPGRNSGKIKYS